MPAIIRTRVGYCGGTTKQPTYENIGDHVETIQIDYDPQQITYEQMLKIFLESHNPCRKPYARQYTSAVYFHNQRQQAAAQAVVAAEEKRRGEKVMTEIAPLPTFYLAEDYHQKYYLQASRPFKNYIRQLYPSVEALINSTAAARLNGYLGWHGTAENAQAELDALGLSEDLQTELLERVQRTR